jgi:hypothetical protein
MQFLGWTALYFLFRFSELREVQQQSVLSLYLCLGVVFKAVRHLLLVQYFTCTVCALIVFLHHEVLPYLAFCHTLFVQYIMPIKGHLSCLYFCILRIVQQFLARNFKYTVVLQVCTICLITYTILC